MARHGTARHGVASSEAAERATTKPLLEHKLSRAGRATRKGRMRR